MYVTIRTYVVFLTRYVLSSYCLPSSPPPPPRTKWYHRSSCHIVPLQTCTHLLPLSMDSLGVKFPLNTFTSSKLFHFVRLGEVEDFKFFA